MKRPMSFAGKKSEGGVLIEDVHRFLDGTNGEKTSDSIHSQRRSSASSVGKILRNASSHLRSSILSAADSCASSILSDDRHMLFDDDSSCGEDSFRCDSSADLNLVKVHIDCDQTCDLSASDSNVSQIDSLHTSTEGLPKSGEKPQGIVSPAEKTSESTIERVQRIAAMMNVELGDDYLSDKPQDELFSSRLLDKNQSDLADSSKRRRRSILKSENSIGEKQEVSKPLDKGNSSHSSKSKHKRDRSLKKSDKKKSLESKSKANFKTSGSEHKKRSSKDPLKKLENLVRLSSDVVIVPAMDEANPFVQLQLVCPVV